MLSRWAAERCVPPSCVAPATRCVAPHTSFQARSAQLKCRSTATQQADGVTSTAFAYGMASAQGPRDTMEDEASVIEIGPGGYMWAGVFDGHGGDSASQWLSSNFFKYWSRQQSGRQSVTATERDISAAFQEADKDLLVMLESSVDEEGQPLTGAGSTASMLFLREDHVVAANVGDSSAVLSRKGRQVMLTSPHRVYGKDEHVTREIARVEAAGGWIADGRVCDVLAVSRAFGDWEFKGKGLKQLLSSGVEYEWWDQDFANKVKFTADPVIVTPAVNTVELCEDDEFIVVATDGLWDFYPQSEAMQFTRGQLKGGASPQSVADQLVERVLKRHTSDNVAVVVVKFPWAFKNTTASSNGAGKKFGFF